MKLLLAMIGAVALGWLMIAAGLAAAYLNGDL